MMVVKCPQCSRSYRLAESLYRRKAAGFGVVITCRHCKAQIHIDEGSLPPPANEAEAESDAAIESLIAPPRTATAEDALPIPGATTANAETHVTTPLSPQTAEASPAAPPVKAADEETTTALPQVAPRAAAAPRPGGIPRPGAAASPPRPGGSATGTPLPVARTGAKATLLGGIMATPNAAKLSATATPTPAKASPKPPAAKAKSTEAELTPTPSPSDPDATPRPRVVALSPGLLGVSTAVRTPSPDLRARPGLDPDEKTPDSKVPVSVPDADLFSADSNPISEPPDSAVPISVDYLESRPHGPPPLPRTSKAAEAKPAGGQLTDKRLPHAPPPRKLPASATAGEPKADDLPSTTGTPKMEDLALASSPLPLSQKKGEPRRKRQASGDLTDDLLSADLGFDAPPALAPPDAAALLKAPVSSRPSAVSSPGSVKPGAVSSTKAPVSRTAAAPGEKKGSGRTFALLLVAAAFGGAGFFLRHRLPAALQREEQKPVAAVKAPVTAEPTPPPMVEAPTASAPEAASAAPNTSATPEASAAPVAATTPTPPSTTTSVPVATTPTAAPTTAKTSTPTSAPVATATPAPTAEKQAATTPSAKPTAEAPAPAPASPAVVEPRGSAGTEPFDVASARAALDATAAQASSCRKGSDPSGIAIVTITFSQTGRVTTANISGPPFQATPTGGCIASTMRKTRVPAFAGEMVTVRKTVTIQ